MAQQTINNGESGSVVRGKINDNFSELYGVHTSTGLYTIDNEGTSPITPQNLLAKKSSTAGSGSILGGMFYVDQTVANTGGPQGVEGYVKTSNASGAVALAIGAIGNIEHSGAGTLTEGRSVQGGGILSGNGTIGGCSPLFSTFTITGSGTITNYHGLFLQAPSLGSGTIINRYGIYQEDALAQNVFAGSVIMSGLPTSSVGLPSGTLWNNSGIVNIV